MCYHSRLLYLPPTASSLSPTPHSLLRPPTAAMPRRRRLLLLLLLPLLLLHLAAAETDPSDAAAMAALSKSLNAAGSLRWTGDDPCSGWDGVFCSAGRVTAIQLRGRGLAGGTVAPEISNLTSLARLELEGCGLGGPLPSFAGMLALQVLLLSNNSFTAVPPGAFAGATALQSVALDNNAELTPWPIPDGLRDAAALVNFSANSANVNGTIPAFFGDGFPSLNHLALAYNSLRGGIPASFAGCSIQSLWLNNQVGDGRLSGSLAVLGEMGNLVQVWLHVNDFTGPLPDFANLTYLRELQVRDNKLTGPVPESLLKLSSLNKVLIKNNLLQGPMPAFPKSVETDADVTPGDNRFCLPAPGDCDARVKVLLSVLRPLGYPAKLADSWVGNDPCSSWLGILCNEGNISVINFTGMNLSGTISPDFSQFKSLQKLILANNGLVGPIPPELATLPSLKELDVRDNKLTGKIPEFKNVVLQTDGNVGIGQDSPPGEAPNSASPTSNSSGNGNSGGSGGSKSSLPVPGIVGSVVGVVVLIIGAYLVFYYCKRRKAKFGRVQSPHATVIHPRHSGSDQEMVKITVASSAAPMNETMSHASSGPSELHVLETPNMVISIQMLRSVTNNFSDDNILGKGGFGTVYKGELHDGTKIAVKRMEASVVTNKGFDEFKSEVAVLSKVRHRHLVALLGYCLDGNERLLVYEYMPQGTLSRCLFNWGEENLKPLEWKKRLSIALDVARGVEYLHSLAHQSFIHRDLKPSNILLGDDLRAKVSDFGLVRLAPDGKDGKVSVATRLAGTFGYLAPEYAATGRVTTKVDVFSFGVILMELITGRKAIEETMPEEAVYLVTWFRRMLINKDSLPKAVDPTIDLTEETLASVTTVTELAGHCCAREPHQRPDMGHAVNVLSCLVDVWKPSSTNYEDNFGIDLDEPLPVALKKWQALEADTRSMFPTESLDDNTQTSLPARPNGFAESFDSSDGR